ncbi:wax ester/triacylglycerol synthase family O-acyltransferase [Aquihabitans sp. G128]|uniref:WS/DGAT/MGAT family O-acyltransferase n=1 Tax=Aquihabitans sp. G128 TaxID=2849779 RepID=UPI001C237A1A|nr:wax ester/triacylglycerol synthase family O-acyltransferase [Aquihabitans sp. G128]QXC62919.1 wax ester/triacylglycerol synthase family O-acyltransferase [Aquihabitans sp. G128]
MERLTGLDAAFLYLENPTNHMHVAMTMVLDPSSVPGGYSFENIKDFIGGRIHLVPPFRRRLVEVPLNLAHPVWVEDPDFDLDFHIRRIGCPAPGGRRELGEMAGQIASTPLDRSRPLWELWVIEGLKQDRIGVVTKVHHSAIDGSSGAELMVHLFDLEPEAADPPAPEEREPESIPTDLELLGHAAASRFRKTVALPKLIGQTVGAVNRVVQGRRDPDKAVGAAPLGAPNTSWCGPLSPLRNVGFARVPLADVRALKTAFECTVNDVVLGLCAGTLRSYMLDRDELPDEPLVAACPVSVRQEGEAAGGNKVSAMFTTLDTQLADPTERIRAIQACTVGAKEEHKAVGADMLQNWAEYAAPNTFNLASRLYASWGLAGSHRPIHNVIISNVPGPPFPLYYAGAEMVAAYPMGPVMEGVGLNITVFSYRDSVDFGFMVDRELVPDVWNMADRVNEALLELQVAAGLAPKPEAKAPAPKRPAKKAPTKKAPAEKKAAAKKAPAKA